MMSVILPIKAGQLCTGPEVKAFLVTMTHSSFQIVHLPLIPKQLHSFQEKKSTKTMHKFGKLIVNSISLAS